MKKLIGFFVAFAVIVLVQPQQALGRVAVTEKKMGVQPQRALSMAAVTEKKMGVQPQRALSMAAVTENKMGVMVPFYIYPTNAKMAPLITARQNYPEVPICAILNPNNGVGTAIDQSYVNAVTKLKAAGIFVVGYVATGYGRRAVTKVQQEVSKWKTWYNVAGIFFDEMGVFTNDDNPPFPSAEGFHVYYQGLTQYTKGLGMNFVIGNPGAFADVSFAQDVDTVIIHENKTTPNLSKFAQWQTTPAVRGRSGMLLYAIPSLSALPAGYTQQIGSYFGWVYVTSDRLPNPWDTLPSYFNQLVATLNTL